MSQTLAISSRNTLFGIPIDSVRMRDAVDIVYQWVQDGCADCRYVVTPNVDHAVMFQRNERLRAAYHDAGLVLADGFPVVTASRLLGRPLPERVTGSDLVPALLAAATRQQPLRLFLLGAAPGVAARAARNIHRRYPSVEVVGTYSPPRGFEGDAAENEAILQRINQARPDILVVGLGAPKQELWVHDHQQQIQASVALCVGATIDFLAGEKQRAPQWMQQCGLEWCHRLLSEPRRLLKRYATDAWIFPQLVLREWWSAPGSV